jgi:hypothetical protein
VPPDATARHAAAAAAPANLVVLVPIPAGSRQEGIAMLSGTRIGY